MPDALDPSDTSAAPAPGAPGEGSVRSMTAFASRQGAAAGASWTWEMRGVNARGLDLRLRLPDGAGALEPTLRARLGERLTRGNVTVGLRLSSGEGGANALALDAEQLDRVLRAFDAVQDRALALGITLAQPTAADVLAQRGVVRSGAAEEETGPAQAEVLAALEADFIPLLDAFCAMRATEGAALARVISGQIDRIAELTEAAAGAAEARRADVEKALSAALARVLQDAGQMPPERIAQELALLAVKADVTEEIDRLRAHVAAARALLAAPAAQGRKLDFLAQEFNREANTLCSKAGAAALTAIGLDLKAVIDQMREQIQNVE